MESTSQLFGNGLKYLSELVAIELRNMEAIGLAQQKMLEGMGVLAQRQAEMAEGTLRRSLPAPASGVQAMVIGQIASLKTTMLESQANSNVLSELAARSSGEVADILQSRMIAALDEFKAAMEQAIPQMPALAAASLTVQPGPQA